MKIKKAGFTLIELLVVIVILGILSTIGFANFKSYYGKAFDAERKAAIKAMGTMVKVDAAGEIGASKYLYDAAALKELFDKNDYKLPSVQDNRCYTYVHGVVGGSAGANNAFAFATVLEDGSILADGTKELVAALEAIPATTGIKCDAVPDAFPTSGMDTTSDDITGAILCGVATEFSASNTGCVDYDKPESNPSTTTTTTTGT